MKITKGETAKGLLYQHLELSPQKKAMLFKQNTSETAINLRLTEFSPKGKSIQFDCLESELINLLTFLAINEDNFLDKVMQQVKTNIKNHIQDKER